MKIVENNYLFEEYNITTADGYILKLHRIPPKNYNKSGAPVVLLQHGILDSSS